MEPLFQELKRYVDWSGDDEAALRRLYGEAAPHFTRIAALFYDRILAHEGARAALLGGESQVGQLKVTLVAWMDRLLAGPWDDDYFQLRLRIGRVHVRIGLPEHYMFGAMNLLRRELQDLIDEELASRVEAARVSRALHKVLDLELAIMLSTYREDLLGQQQKSERLATFGQLVGSIGHELRNPLGVIESSLYILRSRAIADERVQKHIGRIGEQLALANHIVTALLDMIRDRPLEREAVALAGVVASIVANLTPEERARVAVAGVAELPPVHGDAGQLRQALFNLIENALHADPAGGPVAVTGSAEAEGRLVVLAVEDDGPGVDPQIVRRLFEPLVSTKVRGIGLGLALVRRIAKRHEGTVEYVPRPGQGARFVLKLPRGEALA